MKKYFTNFFHIIIDTIKNIFFQKKCPYCCQIKQISYSYYDYFCISCKNNISYISPILHKNKNIPIYALGRYNGILKYLVNQKYSGNSLPFLQLKENISLFLKKFPLSYDIIIPIPKTSINYIKHQFNPPLIIAEHFIKKDENTVLFKDIFFRSTKKAQAEKRISERINNKDNLFFIPSQSLPVLKNKKILIIDDVYTTGNTIDNIIKILPLSISTISIFVIARK